MFKFTDRDWAWDIEATGLLDSSTVDYTASPYKLKDNFKIHSAVWVNMVTDEEVVFIQDEVYTKMKPWILENVDSFIGNNTIDYDHMALMAAIGLDYTVQPDTVCGKPVRIIDNLVLSKTLNPDREAHSVDYYGKLFGYPKIDWRARAIELGLIAADSPRGEEFKTFHPEMVDYMRQDGRLSKRICLYLNEEAGDWPWMDAFQLESAVRDIITRQQHRGFWFDSEAAVKHVNWLDEKMEEIRQIVEPMIPPKPISKTAMKEFTPPKIQFLKNGEPSANIKKWIEKHGGKLIQEGSKWKAEVLGIKASLPLPQESLVKTEAAKISDTTHLKEWLVGLGWNPSAYKERDLTVDAKKRKLSEEKFEAAVERYLEQTAASNFKNDRCEQMEVSTLRGLEIKLKKHNMQRPLKVLTNPQITVGMEKEICPKLLELGDKFPHAKLVSEYLTYRHRRNSILGGNVDPDDDEEEMEKGYLSCERLEQDSRIPTPADTCGAGTSRFKHRLVANIPRVTSLFGKEMRGIFGVDKRTHFQLGYDFDSLEAKIESHYVYKYPGGPEYGVSLTAEKPNDCHSVLAKSISELLGRPFPRGTAKNVKYGCSYNAQVKRVAKTVGCDLATAQIIFDAFWEQAYPLKQLKEKMQLYWETTGQKKFLLGIDGRKLPIRSKGNVINTAFQSAGVICAKRAMVIHDRKLRAAGLAVDFWRDDWKNSLYSQQLIAYHDESQLEVSKKLVTWKMFDTEEEAKAFKKDNPTWSDVGHSDKGYYVGYCEAGVLAVEAVQEAGRYYKLNVELTAGYMLGTNWATCH